MAKWGMILTLLLPGFAARAQQTDSIPRKYWRDKYLVLLAGISAGDHVNGDIGLARITNSHGVHHPASFAWFVSDEIRFANKLLMGPKAGVWIAGGLAMGLNMIYYTDFGHGTLVFRPEIGVGFSNIKLVYGYNARLTNTAFEGINRSLVEFVYGFTLRKIRL